MAISTEKLEAVDDIVIQLLSLVQQIMTRKATNQLTDADVDDALAVLDAHLAKTQKDINNMPDDPVKADLG